MSPRTSLVLHVAPAIALPLITFVGSSFGTVDSFENWLLGNAALNGRSLPLLMVSLVSIAIMFHHFARAHDDAAFKAVVGGTLIGFLVGVLGNTFAGISPLLVIALTIAGSVGGWAFLPRR